ncbi:MAG: 50S ribosomal protein L6, partial [Desulfobacterales bacterium]
MSRVGKKPIPIPEKTEITYENRLLTVAGQKGTLNRSIHPAVDLKIDDNVMDVTMISNDRNSRALQGLTRSLVANMITGVSKGFERVLQINGIGYRAEVRGKKIVLNVG